MYYIFPHGTDIEGLFDELKASSIFGDKLVRIDHNADHEIRLVFSQDLSQAELINLCPIVRPHITSITISDDPSKPDVPMPNDGWV